MQTRTTKRPGTLTLVCEECQNRILRSDGGICVNFVRAASGKNGAIEPFHIWHYRCESIEVNDEHWHRIECDTADELLAHIASLVEKRWFSATGWQSLFRRIVADAQWFPTSRPGRKPRRSNEDDNDETEENDDDD